MSDLPRLLRILETLPGLCATRKEWRLRTGDAYPYVDDLLKPTGRIADRMPCFSPLLGLHYHSVHEHEYEYEDGSAEAVFLDDTHACPSFSVERHERAIMTPDMPGLCRRVCLALELDPETEGLSLPRSICEVGCYYPLESFRFPVVLALKSCTAEVEDALHAVAALRNGEFIFLTATPVHLSDRSATLIAARSILARALTECLLVSEGTLGTTNSWNVDILAFRDKVIPKSGPVMAFFGIPPRSKWTDVTIRFVDGYTVFVDVAGVTGRFSYTEMGMANRRESKPSKQWEFMEKIADNHGIIDFHIGDPDKNPSWKFELSSNLRAFFRIDDDPFWPYDPVNHYWEAKFRLTPVQDV